MSLSIGVTAGECRISQDSNVLSNIGSVIEKDRLTKGDCYMCKFEPTIEDFKNNGTTCKCTKKEKYKNGKCQNWKSFPKKYNYGK